MNRDFWMVLCHISYKYHFQKMMKWVGVGSKYGDKFSYDLNKFLKKGEEKN